MAERKLPETTEKRVQNVTTGKVTVKEKSGGKKLVESFVEEDRHTIGNYILNELLIPTAKDLLSSIVNNSVEMLLYGETSNRRGGRTNYNRISERNQRTRVVTNDDRSSNRVKPRGGYHIKDLTFESRADAELTLQTIKDVIEEYDQASVGDYYNACDVTPAWTDFNYGWYDLSGARIERSRGEWYIALPRPTSLAD